MASEKEAEQSALINLDSLEVRKSRGGGGPGFEESGLIDLSGFTGGGPTETRETAGVPSGGPVVAGFVAAPKQNNTTLMVVLGVVVLAILVVVAVFVGMILAQGDQPQQPIAGAQPPAAPAAAAPAAAPAATAPAKPAVAAADAGAGKADAGATAQADAGSAPVAEAPKPTGDRPARRPTARRNTPKPSAPAVTPPPSAARQAAAEDAPPPAVAEAPKPAPPKPAPPPKEETSEVDDLLGSLNGNKPAAPAGNNSPVAAPADPMLPQSLNRRQILTVVKRNAGGVRKCKAQPPGASGTVTVQMQIEPNGSVSKASVAGGPMKGTAQGNCVERTVKVFRFPQFGGDPMTINMPFAM